MNLGNAALCKNDLVPSCPLRVILLESVTPPGVARRSDIYET
jgi:hypothetical protein